MAGLICECSHLDSDHKQQHSGSNSTDPYACTKCNCGSFLKSTQPACPGCHHSLSRHIGPTKLQGYFACAMKGCTCEAHVATEHANAQTSAVDHPPHYGGASNVYETIKVIDAWQLDFYLGNAVKYISRAGKKDPSKEIEDLQKAAFYLNYRIELLKNQKP